MNKVYEKEIEVNRKKADFSVSEKSLQLGKMRRAKKVYLRISFQKAIPSIEQALFNGILHQSRCIFQV